MPSFEFEVTRNFAVTDTVRIEAETEIEARQNLISDWPKHLPTLPQEVYEALEFQECDITLNNYDELYT